MAPRMKKRLTDEELDRNIDRLIEIRPMANEYSALTKKIKAELMNRKADSRTAKSGNKARLKRTPTYSWLVDLLDKVLSQAAFEALCPRKPETRKLNQRIAAMPEDKALAACRVESGETVELVVEEEK